jgi:hypothetical protein
MHFHFYEPEILRLIKLCTQDDFFVLGGDSLAALAVTKRLLEWDGKSAWPEDGIVEGPLAVQYLLRHRVLGQYVEHLESSGISALWHKPGSAESEKPPEQDSDSDERSPRSYPSCKNSSKEAARSEIEVDLLADPATIANIRALRSAAAQGKLVTVLQLLAASADPNGGFPTAAQTQSITDAPLPKGAAPAQNSRRDTAFTGVPPLHAAANQGQHEVRRVYSSWHASGHSRPHLAASPAARQVVADLLETRARPSMKNWFKPMINKTLI